jgi:hypothetical protein
MRQLLERQFNRLSHQEKQVMHYLATQQQPISFVELQNNFSSPLVGHQNLESFVSLMRRSLIQKTDKYFTLISIIYII